MVFSIAVDILHALKSAKNQKKVSVERHHYTTKLLFEQSLDIYRPVSSKSSSQPLPVVVLVVGSAWLGHRSIIYSGCSWWNSSGPNTVAKLGCTCVCIRHRGAFPKTSSILTIVAVSIISLILTLILDRLIGADAWTVLQEILTTHIGFKAGLSLGRTSAFLLTLCMGLAAVELAGIGSASFDQMQNDVMDAVAFVAKEKKRLELDISNENPIIFGGYSSGGHVAATVLQQPHLWQERKLPSPDKYCESLLYISPVLSTKPFLESSVWKSTMPPSSSMPSLSPSESSLANDTGGSLKRHISKQSSSISSLSSSTSLSSLQSASSPPTWLTTRVVKAIFGDAAAQISSPIHTYINSPSVPTTFIGCKKEMFGLDWLDLFFSSPTYNELLKSIGVDSRYVAVESDHWNILNSNVFSDAMKEELGIVQRRKYPK